MNLLPTKQKKKVKLEILYQNIIFSGLILFSLILILILLLGLFLIFLNFKYQTIEQKITTEQSRIIQTETVRNMERKVKELNKELIDLKEIQKKSSNFYQILDNISKDLLNEVEVYTINMEKDSNKITISGYSDIRAKLLAIKQKLETSSNYKDVDFPISNLTDPKDIEFTFNFVYQP